MDFQDLYSSILDICADPVTTAVPPSDRKPEVLALPPSCVCQQLSNKICLDEIEREAKEGCEVCSVLREGVMAFISVEEIRKLELGAGSIYIQAMGDRYVKVMRDAFSDVVIELFTVDGQIHLLLLDFGDILANKE